MKNSVKKEQVITSEILFGKSLKLKNMKKVLERWAKNRQKLETFSEHRHLKSVWFYDRNSLDLIQIDKSTGKSKYTIKVTKEKGL